MCSDCPPSTVAVQWKRTLLVFYDKKCYPVFIYAVVESGDLPMKLGIYGAGSLGIILGAYITKAGIPIDLINRNVSHVQALKTYGARVEGTVSMTVPVEALLPQDMQGPYDLLFLMTKQLDNPTVVASLVPYLAKDGVLCTLQNGLPEPGIADIIGQDRVLGCTVEWGATLTAPGVSRLTSSPDSLSFVLGSMTNPPSPKLAQAKDVLSAMCPVNIEDNFMGTRWAKLLINTSFSGMSAVLGCTFGEAAADRRARRCVQAVIKECIDVAHAEGIRITPVQGKDIAKLLDYHGPVKRGISSFILPIAIKKHRLLKASMLQDLEHGKATEVDAINGVVAAHGRRYGVPTPYNDRIIDIIHRIEKGQCTPAFVNVEMF